MTENPITQIYSERLKDLVKLCDMMLSGEAIEGLSAEDVVQRVFIRAWEKKEKLAEHENPMGWFRCACVKECQALQHKRIRRQMILGWPVPLTENVSIDEQADAVLRWLHKMETVEILQELQEKLTPLEKRVYEQYYVADRSARETAAVLDLKVSTVNDAARRIREKATKMQLGIFILLLCPILEILRRK